MATSDIKLKEHKYKNYNFECIFVIFIDVHAQNSFPNPGKHHNSLLALVQMHVKTPKLIGHIFFFKLCYEIYRAD